MRKKISKGKWSLSLFSNTFPSFVCCRLFDHYMMMNQKLHSQTWATKILYHVGADEAVLGWVGSSVLNEECHYNMSFFQRTANFDLYIVFDPLISKPQAIMLGNKLIRWINVSSTQLLVYLPVHSSLSSERRRQTYNHQHIHFLVSTEMCVGIIPPLLYFLPVVGAIGVL